MSFDLPHSHTAAHHTAAHSHTKQIKMKEKEIRLLVLGLDNAGKTTLVQRLLILQHKQQRRLDKVFQHQPSSPRQHGGQPNDEAPHQSAGGGVGGEEESSSPGEVATINAAALSAEDDDEDVAALESIEPTLGFRIRTIDHRATGHTLHMWDVGGQTSIRAYWRNYFEKTDGLVFVVDASEPGNDRLILARHELERLLHEERLAGASLLVWANKQDVAGARSAEEIAEILGLTGGDGAESDEGTPSLLRHRHWSIKACSAVTGEGVQEGLDWIVQDIASRIFVLG